jgi:hemophore-related protein
MIKLSLTGLSLALSLAFGAGGAAADPVDPIVSTTCTYPQVMAALNAQDPAAAAAFSGSPVAQSSLRQFLASSPAQRRSMAQQIAAAPGAQQYFALIQQVAATCNNY